jgi:ribosomal protein S18 acetylase RimI-like enzyme
MTLEMKRLEGWFEKQKLMKFLKGEYDNFYLLFDLDNFNFLLGNSAFHYARDENSIRGVILNYYHSTGIKDIWTYGDNESTELLLRYIDRNLSVIHLRSNNNTDMFKDSSNIYYEYCMVNESPSGIPDRNVRLVTPDMFQEYGDLISQWDHTRFVEMEPEQFRNLLNYSTVYGYFDDGKLMSVATLGAVWKDWFMISSVFTDPAGRNKGYAQKLISSMLNRYDHMGKAILFVNKENLPAIKAYSNIGFRKYSENLWVDYGTGLVP